MSSSSPTDSSPHSVICCKRCTTPLFPFSSILSQKIDVWSDTVYTYQLEDVLPDHGVEGGCHLYSATNPGQRRFDVFRVKVLDADEKQQKWSRGTTVNIDSRAKSYSSEHSWFPNFDWTFCECSNCGNHVGWGFAAKENNNDANQEDASSASDVAAKKSRIPHFMGCIFANIIAKEMPLEEWLDHLRRRASVTNRIRLNLLRSAWPALKDDLRFQLMTFISSLLLRYDAEKETRKNKINNAKSGDNDTNDYDTNDDEKTASTTSSKLYVRQFVGLLSRLDNLLVAADAFIIRLRERRRENGENSSSATALEPNTVPYFRDQIDLAEYKLNDDELEKEEQNENVADDEDDNNGDSDDKFATKAIELIRGFHLRWKNDVAAAEEKRRQREKEQEAEHGHSGILALFRNLLGFANQPDAAAAHVVEDENDEGGGDIEDYVEAEETDEDDDDEELEVDYEMNDDDENDDSQRSSSQNEQEDSQE